MRFYTTQKISANRERTPEGYLLIRGTPIARTGVQEYGHGESGITTDKNGRALVSRDEDEVFALRTIASCNGKSLVNEHPDDDVTPENWRELTYGIFMDARRGTGLDEDLLLADLLVTTEEGIGLIESGKTELSCGYDAEYEQTGEGTGRQKNIVVNHIALVDSGRCGPRCSVSDHRKTMTKDCNCHKEAQTDMKVRDKVKAALRAAGLKFKDADSEEKVISEVTGDSDEPMGGAGDGDQHIHVHLGPQGAGGVATDVHDDDEDNKDMPKWFTDHVASNNARFDKIEKMIEGGGAGGSNDKARDEEETEGEMEAEMPEGAMDAVGGMEKVKDSAYFEDSYQNTIAMAEIIAPGIRFPTFDRAADPKKTIGNLTALRVKTLDLAWNMADTRGMIEDITGGKTPDYKKMSTKDVRTLFNAVGAAKKRANSHDNRNGGGSHTVSSSGPVGAVTSLADLNKRNADYYSKH